MADIRSTPGGLRDQTIRLYHDEGDGTHSEAEAAHLRGWDATDSQWYRLPVDHTSGALNVAVVSGGTGGGNLATAAKGTTVAGNPTSRQVDANTQALDVNIAAGGGTGGGPADVGTTTAASETDAARQKVTAALRVLDTGGAAGSQLVALKGDGTNGAFVNVKASALPTGASTAAKQPALGTAGTAAADVITVQGIASMTAVKVDGSAVAQPVTDNAGSLTVDAPVGTPVFVRLSDGAAAITALPITDNAGSLTVDAPVGTPLFATVTPSTTGGWSVDSRTALTATAVAIKASAGTFGGYAFYNPNATVTYIQFFNVAAASVTLGTTAPTFVFGIPATSAANVEFTNGIQMGTAMSYAATTTATGLTAPGTALTGFALFK